ncbi:MAG: lipoate--protein ligase family protein [Thermofilum sp.]|nr:lipoate--protein ligase family protein [Thermofilum sp.]
MKLRVVLDLEGHDAYWQMALDEALLVLRSLGRIANTLRIYRFKPSAVTIGYFQKIRESVNLEFLHERGIQYTRRITGGGSVYHDTNGELTYSVVLPIEGALADASESYRVICSGLVYALRKLGAPGEFIPVNDVAVYGKKISGNAQTRRAGFLLQHGTLMYATDLDTVEKALLAPREKLESKGVRSIRERVITLREVIGEVDVNALVESLIEGFSKALSAEVYHDVLSEEELRAADNLVAKYRSPEWIFKR